MCITNVIKEKKNHINTFLNQTLSFYFLRGNHLASTHLCYIREYCNEAMKDNTSKPLNNSTNFVGFSAYLSSNNSFTMNKNSNIRVDGEDDVASFLTDSSIPEFSIQGEYIDDYTFYNPLPLNRNNLYSSNLYSENNSTSQIIENYRNIVLNNYKEQFNITSTQVQTNSLSPQASRPGSSLNKPEISSTSFHACYISSNENSYKKKPHIEDLIDVASNINSTIKHNNVNSTIDDITNSSCHNSHIPGDILSSSACYQKINENYLEYYAYPLKNNFSVHENGSNIQYYINHYFKLMDNIIIKSDTPNSYKTLLTSDEIIDLIDNKTRDECIDRLIEVVLGNRIEKKTQKLSQVYKLTEPAMSFIQYIKKRVCTILDKGTIISAIIQLRTVYSNIIINDDEQHKFVMSVLKINYKLNNDKLEISNNTFSKLVGMKIDALNMCELELLKMIP